MREREKGEARGKKKILVKGMEFINKKKKVTKIYVRWEQGNMIIYNRGKITLFSSIQEIPKLHGEK